MRPIKKGIGINERWQRDLPHDPRSKDLYAFIQEYDFQFNHDAFDFKSGGDGDNGEQLMYMLDEYFDQKEGKPS